MKKILFLIKIFLVLYLAACTPTQVTVTSQVTVTLAPTEIPTPTPEPTSQAFIDLQTQIAQSPIYTLTPNGFEMKNEDGTITLVPNIKPNATAEELTFTITYEGQEFIVEFDSIEEKQLNFTGEEDRIWISDGKNLVHSYFENELAQMTPEQKLKASPEIEGLVKSNVSTVKDGLVIYRDEKGNAIKVFNLLTAQELSLPEAGIYEFRLTTGGKLEVPEFHDNQSAMDFVASDAMWFEGNKSNFYKNYPEQTKVFEEIVKVRDSFVDLYPPIKDGRWFGIYPPNPYVFNERFFNILCYIKIENGISSNENSGLILMYPKDNDTGFGVVSLNDPNLISEIAGLKDFLLHTWKYNGNN